MSKITIEFDEAELKTLICEIMASKLYSSLLSSITDKNDIIKRAKLEAEKRIKDEMYENMRKDVQTI